MDRNALRIDAARLVVAKIVADRLKAWTTVRKAEILEDIEPGEKVKATLPDGRPIGHVQRTEPIKRIKVNVHELMPWIREHRPDEIVPSIRESYLNHLTDLARKYGHAFDKESGEIIPGVYVEQGEPQTRIVPNEAGYELVDSQFTAMLALPGETESE